MGKTNYTKVEDAIERGMYGLKVEKLLQEADEAQGKGKHSDAEKQKIAAKQMVAIIEHDLQWMAKREDGIYKQLKIKKKRLAELNKLVNNPDITLKKEEIDEIKNLKEAVEKHKKAKFSNATDEEYIQKEIGRHVYKRHNTREKWIPLDTHADWYKYKKKRSR